MGERKGKDAFESCPRNATAGYTESRRAGPNPTREAPELARAAPARRNSSRATTGFPTRHNAPTDVVSSTPVDSVHNEVNRGNRPGRSIVHTLSSDLVTKAAYSVLYAR